MSTTTLDRKSIRNSVGPGPAFHRVLNSEFIKFRTLMSTLILLPPRHWSWWASQLSRPGEQDSLRSRPPPIPKWQPPWLPKAGDLAVSIPPTSGISFAQLILGSLGVLLMSSEFTTGMARSTFAAVPKRLTPFLAKLIVVMVSAFLLTAVSIYIAGLVSLPIVDTYDLKLDLGSSQSIKLLLVNSLYVAAVAAIGMALGTIVRNSAGGIMSLVGLLFVAPIAFQLIPPGDFFKEANKYLPTSTITPMTAVEHVPDTLEAWQAALVLGAWVVVPVALAMVLLKKRDV